MRKEQSLILGTYVEVFDSVDISEHKVPGLGRKDDDDPVGELGGADYLQKTEPKPKYDIELLVDHVQR